MTIDLGGGVSISSGIGLDAPRQPAQARTAVVLPSIAPLEAFIAEQPHALDSFNVAIAIEVWQLAMDHVALLNPKPAPLPD